MAKARSTYDEPTAGQEPPASTAPPPEPPKRYKVLKEFVDAGGARWLAGSEIGLAPEEAEKQLGEGTVEEAAPPAEKA